MPTRVVVGFVKTSAYGGAMDEDLFYFHHIGVSYMNHKVASRSIRKVASRPKEFVQVTIKITTHKAI